LNCHSRPRSMLWKSLLILTSSVRNCSVRRYDGGWVRMTAKTAVTS
jgi:hypothetical protein